MKYWLTLLLLICAAMVFTVWFYFPDYLIEKSGNNVAKAAAYSEIYGAVSALFGSLAFVLLVYTALMQREELKLQRQELKATREELARSAKSQEELVRLTRESNEFQRHVRRNDTWPELMIIKNAQEAFPLNTEKKLATEVTLTPKLTALKVKKVFVQANTSIIVDQEFMEKHYLNQIIEVGAHFVLLLLHNKQHDAQNISVYLELSNIDGTNTYEQYLISDATPLFRITGSTAITF